jgi:hypothetical protein
VVGTVDPTIFVDDVKLTESSHHIFLHCPTHARLGHDCHVPLLLRLAVQCLLRDRHPD